MFAGRLKWKGGKEQKWKMEKKLIFLKEGRAVLFGKITKKKKPEKDEFDKKMSLNKNLERLQRGKRERSGWRECAISRVERGVHADEVSRD